MIAAIAKALEKAAFPVFGDGGARHRNAGVAAGEPRRHLAGRWQNCNLGCELHRSATRSPERQTAGGDTEACGSCQRREIIRAAVALWVSSFGVVYNATSPLCAPKDGPSQLPPT